MNEITAVVCPHCRVVNRVPTARLFERPNCGRCHRGLFVGEPVALDEAGFERFLSRGDTPLLVDFWAPWCGPCVQMAPAFAAAAARLEPRVRLGKIDAESASTLAGRFAIRSIPTLILFEGGRERARRSGAMSTTQLLGWVGSVLPGAS